MILKFWNPRESIPPDEPFEDLGCVDGSPKVHQKTVPQTKSEPVQAVVEEPIIPKTVGKGFIRFFNIFKIENEEQTVPDKQMQCDSPPSKVGRQESPRSIPGKKVTLIMSLIIISVFLNISIAKTKRHNF